MSDILHRLRLANGIMLDAEREEAAAEIERLRDALDSQIRISNTANAEIERLREEKVALISAKEVTITPPALPEGFVIDELRKTIVALHADIARIREEGQKDYDGMREFQRKFIDASHEIERLRSELEEYTLGVQKRDAEIERLRDAAVIARTTEANLHEEIRRKQADIVSLARDLGSHKAEIERLRNEVSALRGLLGGGRTELIDRYEAEIERLRELLREGIKYPGGEPPLWRKRVREALGETQ